MRMIDAKESPRLRGWADWRRGTGMCDSLEASGVADSIPVDEYEQERSRLFDEARELGYLDGIRGANEAIVNAEMEARDRIALANEAESSRLQADRDRLAALITGLPVIVEAHEANILDAAIDIALAAMTRWLCQRPDAEVLADICRQALNECRHRPMSIRVATCDLAEVSGTCASADVRIVADPRLKPGSCELDSARGTYATGIDLRLVALRDILMAPRNAEIAP